MQPEEIRRERQVMAVFQAVLEQPAGARAAYLDGVCGDDATLRQRVADLLIAYDAPDAFLETPATALIVLGPPAETGEDRWAVSHGLERLGDGLLQAGDSISAQACYRQALLLRAALARTRPADADLQRDLDHLRAKLSQLSLRREGRGYAC